MKRILLISAALLTALTISSCKCEEKAEKTTGIDNETIQTIMSRKSVRSFTDQPIPAEYMETMLKAAMAAPTGSNIQPWHVPSGRP